MERPHEAAPSIHNSPPPMCYSSIWLSMNVLILNPKTICVEASEEKMIKQMESFGMDVIPVPFRDAYAFGGSLHCATTDVYREGECEDYFPNQPWLIRKIIFTFTFSIHISRCTMKTTAKSIGISKRNRNNIHSKTFHLLNHFFF